MGKMGTRMVRSSRGGGYSGEDGASNIRQGSSSILRQSRHAGQDHATDAR